MNSSKSSKFGLRWSLNKVTCRSRGPAGSTRSPTLMRVQIQLTSSPDPSSLHHFLSSLNESDEKAPNPKRQHYFKPFVPAQHAGHQMHCNRMSQSLHLSEGDTHSNRHPATSACISSQFTLEVALHISDRLAFTRRTPQMGLGRSL